MNTVTLFCQAGQHQWERPSQRGRRPASCPACLTSAAITAPIVAAPAHEALCDRALDALDSLDTEAQRKVEYIIDQLVYRNREAADVAHLSDTLSRLVAA